ncbi:hypothetical protein A4G99_09640 [Haladaptatus sp. R4]|uniref:ABC transporter permease n=1 Tax=Haladaptatus sp. R4 TaxID=1679489 RepID=UPI0007B4C52B|nr:hypothetical protein [Haladaptatus sp. R4]KZN24611.1 hypothetical protein A4G99_09640 [Haladaptatus sp. R4]
MTRTTGTRTKLRQSYHVARADFLQRARSRRLLVVLAVIAYVGYLVNVGGIKLAYQIHRDGTMTAFHGEPTAAYIGLKAGLTGSVVLLFVGFYLMKNVLDRDRKYEVTRLVASTPISDRTYLVGKWLSNVALGVVIVVTLGLSTIANHAVNGVGPTNPISLLFPLFVFALPLCALVGAVSLLFETVDTLNGTFGNICYFLLVPMVLGTTLSPVGSTLPSELPLWTKGFDVMGYLAVYSLTAGALLAQQPMYDGGLPSVGTLEAQKTFFWNGGAWPHWVFPQRLGLVLLGLLVVFLSTVPFDRLSSTEPSSGGGWFPRLRVGVPTFGVPSRIRASIPVVGGTDSSTSPTGGQTVESVSLTPVESRGSGEIRQLAVAELRLALRGRRWWWYCGAALLVAIPLGSLLTAGVTQVPVDAFRTSVYPLAFVWPLLIWSEMGVRTVRHRMMPLVLASTNPIRQLVAEWLAGVLVAVAVGSGMLVVFVVTGRTALLAGFASGVLLPPSLASAAGGWSRTSTLFELSYLALWYVGPLNGGSLLDFIGVTTDSVAMGVPFAFIGVSAVLFGLALFRRKLEIE